MIGETMDTDTLLPKIQRFLPELDQDAFLKYHN
jgi:hypothetical protein